KEIGLYSGATVLGNAELALILDPGAIATRAGIRMSAEDEAGEAEMDAVGDSGSEFLLVEIAGRRAAIPLDRVIRIEQLPVSRIEQIGCRAVLNFDGQLVPVEDAGGLLASALGNPAAPLIVVICREGERHVGIAVARVLDVAAGGRLFEAGTNQPAAGVTLLKERVTGVVELGAVAPLPAELAAANALAAQNAWAEAMG
ncbi:MAG TPA: chemotaxis protein CheW, partial [Steroidobacteraceae bacterium]|nr:chemotaxis protein CheW [Steroidobacteraceae bacterium]